MARFFPFRRSAEGKLGIKSPRRVGSVIAVWLVLAAALWSGVHFGLAVPSSYPFEVADWSRAGDYATNSPQVKSLVNDITDDFPPVSGQSGSTVVLPTNPNTPNPTQSPLPTASPQPTPTPDPWTLELVADRSRARRGDPIKYTAKLSTEVPLTDVEVTLNYPSGLLAESQNCTGQSPDICDPTRSDGKISCQIAAVEPGTSESCRFTLIVRIDAQPGSVIHSWATATWSDASEPIMSDRVLVTVS